MRPAIRSARRQQGVTMLEVLITIIIVTIGLLGIAGLQARAHVAELESYQRAQALVLLYDMVDRVNNNRLAASCYAFTTDTTNGTPYVGTAGDDLLPTPVTSCAASSPAINTLANGAINDWDDLLRGAAEQKGGSEVGAMLGARGCVSYDASTEFLDGTTGLAIGGTGMYKVEVSWQGMAETIAPATATCGKNLYGSETKRRTVWVTMRLATLAAR